MPWHRMLVVVHLCLISLGCQNRPWEHMTVVPPVGAIPQEVFEEIRTAAFDHDLRKVYGCMTVEARRDQISTLINDILHLAYRAEHDEKFVADSPSFRKPLTESQMRRAQNCLQVAKKHHLIEEEMFPSGGGTSLTLDDERRIDSYRSSYVKNADEFVADAWQALNEENWSLFDADAHLGELTITGDYAIARVHDFRDRYGQPEHGYIHFKKIDGHWLIDMSPWWSPWGPASKSL